MNISEKVVRTPLVQKLYNIGLRRTIVIGTHDGSWHADDLLAIAIIREALPEMSFSVIRSRDPFTLQKADIIVDVGGGEYDHHHSANKRYPNGIPYAACGLVLDAVEPNRSMVNMLNTDLVYAVSAKDNGYYDPHLGHLVTQSKLDWVGLFYPTWQERQLVPDSDIIFKFYAVLDMVQNIYKRVRANCQARVAAEKVLSNCPTYLNGEFIELACGGIPWTKYGYEHKKILGAVYQDDSKQYWIVRAARDNSDSFCTRVSFPASWGGLENRELARVSGINDIIFCHKALFMATFKTRAAANNAMRILSYLYHNN